jgi:hypothetical protein
MKFLYAHWRNLLLANYVVPSSVLERLVPKQTSLDEFEGQLFVSLVAFLFDETRVLGIPVPFHRRFEEVNLRFYVTPHKDRSIRAVTFIKEIVPKPIIPWIANTLFSENYVALPMAHGYTADEYWYTWGDSGAHRFSARIESEPTYPAPGSIGEFITEHYWGYAQGRGATLEYRVAHPQWKCCEVHSFNIDVDFAETYGKDFQFLNGQSPVNVLYAEGSPVTVSFPKRLRD